MGELDADHDGLYDDMCSCGSGLESIQMFDARGIFVAYVCSRCITKVKCKYRPEIFSNPNYEADEPIEPED